MLTNDDKKEILEMLEIIFERQDEKRRQQDEKRRQQDEKRLQDEKNREEKRLQYEKIREEKHAEENKKFLKEIMDYQSERFLKITNSLEKMLENHELWLRKLTDETVKHKKKFNDMKDSLED